MKHLLFYSCVLLGLQSWGQPSCQFKHQFWDDIQIPSYKSGNESLRSDTINVIHYGIYLDFTQATSNILSGSCQVNFETLMDVNTLNLDLLQLNIDSIVFQGTAINYNYNDTLIVCDLGTTLNSGTVDSITVYYNGIPQMDPSGWGGFYMQGTYFYNLGVGFESDPHNYGRVWHPCFDNFVERATYDFQILTNNGFTAYCNGTRTAVQTVGTDSLLTSWVLNTEIPTYLASVAVANYVHVSDPYYSNLQGISIPVWLAARSSDTTNLKNSFVNLHNALEAYESYYGPYVWERVGYCLVPFSSGAMEHATNIAYPQLAANGTTSLETLMAHELSHHWWGDWVTCETAEEMWINEGMAVYSEFLFLEFVYSWDAYMSAMRENHYEVLHKAHINDSGYYALNAVPIKYTYGDHSYKKGADVMHTLRSYIGDANFFAGLQAIQTTYGGSHISSYQFRDVLNTLGGIDVSDFFDDWIFQAGFSQFSISQSSAVQNGSTYDVTIVVDQKLKGASAFHNNVPLTVTFKDENWNTHNATINMSGDYAQFVISAVPFEPVFIALNMDEKINDAITAEDIVIQSNGIKLLSYANMRLNVQSITDSAYVRVEHNWVYADNLHSIPNMIVSQDRYWNVHGVDMDKVWGEMRFDFNAQNTSIGDLDHSIMNAVAGQPFHEDSLVLLYRPDAQSEWTIHPNFTINTTGIPTDKKGWIDAVGILPGQYCFGYRVHSVGIQEASQEKTYSIFPNPATDTVSIDLGNWEPHNYRLEIYGINGVYIESRQLKGGTKTTLDVNQLESAVYLFVIKDEQHMTIGSKRVIIR